MRVIADDLLDRNKKEVSIVDDKHTEKSIIGLLSACFLGGYQVRAHFPNVWAVKAETSESGLVMSNEEVVAQVRSIFINPADQLLNTTIDRWHVHLSILLREH